MDQVVHRAVALGGDFRRRAAIAQVLADRIAVIALVGEHGAGITVALLHQLVIGGDIMCLAVVLMVIIGTMNLLARAVVARNLRKLS